MTIDANTALLIGGGLCLLCVVGIILSVGLQIVGVFFQLISGVFEFVFGIVGGNPCGCVVGLGMLAICGGIAFIVINGLSACGTPQATNFCTFFGR